MEVGMGHSASSTHSHAHRKQKTSFCSMILTAAVISLVVILIFYVLSPAASPCAAKVSGKHAASVPGDKVVEITSDKHLDELLSGTAPVVIMFFAPWCGHCKNCMPAYKEACSENTGPTQTYLADCHSVISSPKLKDLGIQGFPTIMKSHDGKVDTFSGPRTKEEFLKFMH